MLKLTRPCSSPQIQVSLTAASGLDPAVFGGLIPAADTARLKRQGSGPAMQDSRGRRRPDRLRRQPRSRRQQAQKQHLAGTTRTAEFGQIQQRGTPVRATHAVALFDMVQGDRSLPQSRKRGHVRTSPRATRDVRFRRNRASRAHSAVCLLDPRRCCRQQAAKRVGAEVVADLGQAVDRTRPSRGDELGAQLLFRQRDHPAPAAGMIAFDGTRSRGVGHRDDSFSSRAGAPRAIAMATFRSCGG